MSKENELRRINEFFYNLDENTNGIIDKVEFLPKEISTNVFVSGIRLESAAQIELHVKTIRGFQPRIMQREELTSLKPESEAWIDASTFSEETLKLVINDFIRQVDNLDEYHILLTKYYEHNSKQPNIEVTLCNSKKNAYKQIMMTKRMYETFLCTYKALDKFGRLTTLKTFKNLTKVNNKTTNSTNTNITHTKIITDMELVTCNVNTFQ